MTLLHKLNQENEVVIHFLKQWQMENSFSCVKEMNRQFKKDFVSFLKDNSFTQETLDFYYEKFYEIIKNKRKDQFQIRLNFTPADMEINLVSSENIEGSTYNSYKGIKIKGADYRVMVVSGKRNYVNIKKISNNPWRGMGNDFESFEQAEVPSI